MRRLFVALLMFLPSLGVTAQKAVDLGLSVKWASCNLGASNESEQGILFAWGATVPVQYYDWAFYPLCRGNFNELIKYNLDPTLGEVDARTMLEKEDDAAVALWGPEWRIPSSAEWKELMTECNCEIGRRGCTFRSRKTGYEDASIFLPFIAGKSGGEVYASRLGYYWSSTLCTSSCWSAVGFTFYNATVERAVFGRYLGCAVRAVCDR